MTLPRRLVLFLAPLLLASCAAMAMVTQFDRGLPKTLSNGTFELVIDRAQTDIDRTDYYFFGTLQNVGTTEAAFDAGDLEARDEDSGLSHFSIGRGAQSVTLPAKLQFVITKTTLKPGQKIKGAFLFPTPRFDAKAKRLRLIYGPNSVVFEP